MEITAKLRVRKEDQWRHLYLWSANPQPTNMDELLTRGSVGVQVLREENKISIFTQPNRTILQLTFQEEHLGPRQYSIIKKSIGQPSHLTLEKTEGSSKIKIICPWVRDWCEKCFQELRNAGELKSHKLECQATLHLEVPRTVKWAEPKQITKGKPADSQSAEPKETAEDGQSAKTKETAEGRPADTLNLVTPSSKKRKRKKKSDPDQEATDHVHDCYHLAASPTQPVQPILKCLHSGLLRQVSLPISYKSAAVDTKYRKEIQGEWIVYTLSLEMKAGEVYPLDMSISAVQHNLELLPNFHVTHESGHVPLRFTTFYNEQPMDQILHLYCRTHEPVPHISSGDYVPGQTPHTSGESGEPSELHHNNWLKTPTVTKTEEKAHRVLAGPETSQYPVDSSTSAEITSLLGAMSEPMDSTTYSSQQSKFCKLDTSQKGNEGKFRDILVLHDRGQHFVDLNPQQMGKWAIKPGNTIALKLKNRQPFTVTYQGDKRSPNHTIMPSFISETDHHVPREYLASVLQTTNNYMLSLNLQALESSPTGMNYLFPGKHSRSETPVTFLQNDLSHEQQQAVTAVRGASPKAPFLIQGPAGSGKSKIGVEITLQSARTGKVLVTTPTNVAADEMAKKIYETAKIHLPHLNVKRFSTTNHLGTDCETLCFLDTSGKHILPAPETLAKVDVLVSTVASAGRLGYTKSGPIKFELVVMDEAAFALEYAQVVGLLPLTQNCQPRLVLLGDVYQISQKSWLPVAKKWETNRSLFCRLLNLEAYKEEDSNKFLLCSNHRNPPVIVKMINHISYQKKLVVAGTHLTDGEVYAFHIAGANQKVFASNAIYTEALLAARLVKHLKEKEPELSYVIISFYRAQATIIRQCCLELGTEVEVKSAETAQGGEADVVVLSPANLMSSPDMRGRGDWMKDPSRTLVALSRARSRFFLLGNLLTCAYSQPLSCIVKQAKKDNRLKIPKDLEEELDRRLEQWTYE